MKTTNYETQENNKLIAEFMGLKPRLISPDVYGYSDGTFFSCTHDTPEKVVESISKYVKYHSEWNWIMPVIAKVTILEEFQEQSEFNELFWDTFTQLDINDIYQQVVSFIKWYNANK